VPTSVLARLRSWLRAAFRGRALNHEMREELRLHAEMQAADLERGGVARDEAVRRARAELGSFDGQREEMRQSLGLRLLDELRGDVSYALRTLRRSPVFACTAILTIALGIGANAAILSLMEAAMWQPLPVREPQRLRVLGWVSGQNDVMDTVSGPIMFGPDGARVETPVSYTVFNALRNAGEVIEDACAFRLVRGLTAMIDGRGQIINVSLVSGNYFQMLGVSAAVGRAIADADDSPRAQPVGVISDGFWMRQFGGDPGVIGRRIEINGLTITIVGVAPRGFSGTTAGTVPSVFLPISAQPVVAPYASANTPSVLDRPAVWWFSMLARVKPGVSDPRAAAALQLTFQRAVAASLPDRLNVDQPYLRVLDGSRGVDEMRHQLGRPLAVLSGVVGGVLMLACANLSNLLLTRTSRRRREIAMRLSLGAGRFRIARQMVTEGLVLALLGGSAGVLLGFWLRNAIPSLLATSGALPPFGAAFTARVTVAAVVLSALTGMIFSVAPAWRAAKLPALTTLKDAGRGPAHRRTGALGFIVLQVALAGVLLTGAGLFVRTLANLNRAELGFQPDRIVLFGIALPRSAYAAEQLAPLYHRVEDAVRRIPGVRDVTMSTSPLAGNDTSTTMVGPDGRAHGRTDADRSWLNDVGPGFFEMMGIHILQGRGFQAADGPGDPLVAIVNQQFVRKFFPTGEVLGRVVRSGAVNYRVVGVAADARFRDVRSAPPPTLYRAYRQLKDVNGNTFAVRADVDQASLSAALGETLRDIDPRLLLRDVRSQREQIESTMSQERLFAVLTSAFGVLAVALTCLGIYGVVAQATSQRTAEIGVRMALGAQRREVVTMLLRESAAPIVIGLAAAGLGIAFLGRFLTSFLYELRPSDPLTIAAALLLVLLTGLAASYMPARRASRLPPTVALRHD
jgi:predicted permease